MSDSCDVIVLGGGIAGLTVASEIARAGRSVTVVEREPTVGGLARTFRRDGFSFDLGGHRFHSNNPDVVAWLRRLVGSDLLQVRRSSRIRLVGHFIDYPVRLAQASSAFGPLKSVEIAASYARGLFQSRNGGERSFEDWVTRRFGRALYEIYFKPYTEKVWGIPCRELSADWAAQRIGLPSLTQAVYRTLFPGRRPAATIVPDFHYPRFGYGTIGDRLAEQIDAAGHEVLTSTAAVRVTFDLDSAMVDVRHASGVERTLTAGRVISTIPIDVLLRALAHDPEVARVAAESRLKYRGIVLVFLALDRPQVSGDSWTYFPDPSLLFGRSHEPRNWSRAMVPGDAVTSLALEIFSSPGDPNWQAADDTLVARAVSDLEGLGWARRAEILGSWVLRVPNAYPVYSLGYAAEVSRALDVLRRWPRLSLAGRTGSFRYVNVDGIVEDSFRLIDALGLASGGDAVRKLPVDAGRWV
jgi:protoporphyrinogen oxidase